MPFTPVKAHCWLRLRKHKWVFHKDTLHGPDHASGVYQIHRYLVCSECREVKHIWFRVTKTATNEAGQQFHVIEGGSNE